MTQIKATLSIALLLLFSTAGFAQEENRQAAQTNWPMERGDVTSSGAVKDSIGDEFEIDWEFKYPKGAFESSPIIVANKDTRTVFVAGIDVNVKGKLFSIDLDSGKTNWEFAIEEGFVSSPAWHEGRVYVPDLSGLIHCINADNGEEQWSFETEGKISSGGNFFESLVLFGSEDATLYAIDRESGELQWSHTIDDQIQCGATVAGDRCFLAGCDSKLHIVGLTKGKELSALKIDSPTGTTAAAFGENVFFGTENGSFYSINYSEPTINWRWEDPAEAVSIRSSASVTDTHIVFGARNRQVNCLDPKDGSLIWSTKVKAKVDGSPIIAGDRVYVGSTDGRFYVLDLADGEPLWETEFNGSIYGSPAIFSGAKPRLVVATERGVVYCLKPIP